MPAEIYNLLVIFGIVIVFEALVFLTRHMILKWSDKLKPQKSKKADKKTKA